jgi:hypothetical protein
MDHYKSSKSVNGSTLTITVRLNIFSDNTEFTYKSYHFKKISSLIFQ